MTDNRQPTDAGPHALMHPGSTELGRNLGVGSIVFMVLAGAAPLAVVGGMVPIVLATSQSLAAPVFYTIAAIVLAVFAVGFTAMSGFVKNAGAFYTYIQTGLGRTIGGGAALLAVCSYVLLLISTYHYTGALVVSTLERYVGSGLLPAGLWSVLLVAIVAVLGYRDIELSARVLTVLLLAETAVVVVLDIGILVAGGDSGASLTPFNPAEITHGAPGLGIMFAFLGFIGFEATAVFRNEARDPDRTIPRATYIACIGIGVFYAASSWAVVLGAGTDQAVDAATDDATAMVPNLASRYVGPVLSDVMSVLIVTSFVAAMLTFHNVVTRYLYSLGQTGLMPSTFTHIDRAHGAPSRASVTVSVTSLAVVGIGAMTALDPVLELYTWYSGAATLGLVTLMTLTSVSVIVFFRRTASSFSVWRTLVAPVAATLGLGAVLVTMVDNFDMLAGSATAAVALEAVVALAFVAGLALSTVVAKRRTPPTA